MESTSDLRLSVLAGPGDASSVPVRAINWSEVQAAFPAEEAPTLLIGQSVELGFRGPGLDGLARVRAYVARRIDAPRERIYAFQLDHSDGTALDDAVNRRGSIRVTPDPIAPVQVVLREGRDGAPIPTLLRDISEGGLSVLVGREQEWLLAQVDRVRIELRLPGRLDVLALDGRVRHRRLERTAIHYGIQFTGPVAGAEEPAEAIRAFVAERRSAMRARLGSQADAA
jgi:hypothetical protein